MNKGITQPSLRVERNTKPIFCKAHHVPFALRGKGGPKELDRLESLGIIEPIEYSEWASPIVAVLKTDQSIRLCGDNKMTVNKCRNLDLYQRLKIYTQNWTKKENSRNWIWDLNFYRSRYTKTLRNSLRSTTLEACTSSTTSVFVSSPPLADINVA